MSENILNELSDLRKIYIEERKRREKEGKSLLEKATEELAKAKKATLTEEKQEYFENSLNSLEGIYSEIVDTYSHTKGLNFSPSDYISALKYRDLKKGDVDNYFVRLVKECKQSIKQINNNTTPEQDISPLKTLCQGLVDLYYVVANAKALIMDTEENQKARRDHIANYENRLAEAEKKQKELTKIENFDCFNNLMKFKNKIIEINKEAERVKLSNETINKNDNNVLLGFYLEDVKKEDLEFAKDVLNLNDSYFSTSPAFFNLTSKHNVILVNAKEEFYNGNDFNIFIRNLYFSFINTFEMGQLYLTGFEDNEKNRKLFISGIGAKIQKDINDSGFDGLFILDRDKNKYILNSSEELGKLKKSLTDLASERSTKYITKDIFEYNKENMKSKDYFLLTMINRYPYGFEKNSRGLTKEDLCNLSSKGEQGIMMVIFQSIDVKENGESIYLEENSKKDGYSNKIEMLNKDTFNCDVIDVFGEEGKRSYTLNDRPISSLIRSSNFNEDEFFKNYKEKKQNLGTVSLYEILKDKEFTQKKKSFYDEIVIPMGYSDQPFQFKFKPATPEAFGLIIGKTGSGKSSFLHTMILSAASQYSPDELKLRLIDFKSDDSPEFSQYEKSDKENLYIPHVDYLLTKGKSECALDLFDSIEKEMDKRNRIIKAVGSADFKSYNVYAESHNKQKLPFILYIVDEYNKMLEGKAGEYSFASKIRAAIASAIKSIRSSGIGIIFSGQTVNNGFKDEVLGQMSTRISLLIGGADDYASLMNVRINEANQEINFLRGYGYSIFSVDSGRTRIQVSHAYSGKTGCQAQLDLARSIRNKYGQYEQMVAGSEDFYNVKDDMNYYKSTSDRHNLRLPIGVASASMNKVTLNFSDGADQFNYCALLPTEKLINFERNISFAYLNEMSLNGKKDNKVIYMADRKECSQCFDSFFETYPLLKNKFEIIKGYKDRCKKIHELYGIYKKRKKESVEFDYDYDPIFILVHSVKWLLDENETEDWYYEKDDDNTDNSVNTRLEELDKEAEKYIIDIYTKNNKAVPTGPFMSAKKSEYIKKYHADEYNKLIEANKNDSEKLLDIKEYQTEFVRLYKEGFEQKIFVVICSERTSELSESRDLRDAIHSRSSTHSIFGSEKERNENGSFDKDSPISCISIPPGIKTRLYNYDVKENKEFWDQFIKKIS